MMAPLFQGTVHHFQGEARPADLPEKCSDSLLVTFGLFSLIKVSMLLNKGWEHYSVLAL